MTSEIEPCNPNPCGENADCHAISTRFVCTCRQGYASVGMPYQFQPGYTCGEYISVLGPVCIVGFVSHLTAVVEFVCSIKPFNLKSTNYWWHGISWNRCMDDAVYWLTEIYIISHNKLFRILTNCKYCKSLISKHKKPKLFQRKWLVFYRWLQNILWWFYPQICARRVMEGAAILVPNVPWDSTNPKRTRRAAQNVQSVERPSQPDPLIMRTVVRIIMWCGRWGTQGSSHRNILTCDSFITSASKIYSNSKHWDS